MYVGGGREGIATPFMNGPKGQEFLKEKYVMHFTL